MYDTHTRRFEASNPYPYETSNSLNWYCFDIALRYSCKEGGSSLDWCGVGWVSSAAPELLHPLPQTHAPITTLHLPYPVIVDRSPLTIIITCRHTIPSTHATRSIYYMRTSSHATNNLGSQKPVWYIRLQVCVNLQNCCWETAEILAKFWFGNARKKKGGRIILNDGKKLGSLTI